MLSRSNSTAGARLRRAKSTSSTHTSSSGHARTSTSTDPFVTRRQAEVAAVEAYQRAREFEEPTRLSSRPVPPKVQRRRSQAGGRTEGSHFEEARLGRKRSTARKDDVDSARPEVAPRALQSTFIEDNCGEDIVVTRKRSVILPQPSNRSSQYGCYLLPSTTKHPRKSQSDYTDGSPVPRNTSALKEQSSTLAPCPAYEQARSGYRDIPANLSNCGPIINDTLPKIKTPEIVIRKTQTDPETIALARDKCFQDFHHGRLRERASSIFGALHKWPAPNLEKNSASRYDNVLPPYNFAHDVAPPPLPLYPPGNILSSVPVAAEEKKRSFSNSVKGRFLKVFRKSSRVPSGLPAQHVESKHCHYSINSASLADPAGFRDDDENDPFVVKLDSKGVATPQLTANTTDSVSSAGGQSVARSRISSWTNSTATGTWSTLHPIDGEDVAAEFGKLKRSDSMSTLRKASSFLGRPIKKKLHRPSKAELQCSEESEKLYSALQERMKPVAPALEQIDARKTPEPSYGGLASLPSQQKSCSNQSITRRITIRPVNLNLDDHKLAILSPVVETRTPEAVREQSIIPFQGDEKSDTTPRSQLQRRPAMKAPIPSKEQIAQRLERSRNRWQSPLDDMSPPAPRLRRDLEINENPYTLRSLTSALDDRPDNGDLPYHARVFDQRGGIRPDVLSPSIYSSGTNEATPRPDSPDVPPDTMITITSREVRRYSISPPKSQQRTYHTSHGSQDWRRWLSNEMNAWGDSPVPEDFSLPQDVFEKRASPSSEKLETHDAPDDRLSQGPQGSISGTKIASDPIEQSLTRKRQSFMNERYPMVEAKRDPGAPEVNTSFGDAMAHVVYPFPREKATLSTQRATLNEHGHDSSNALVHTSTLDQKRTGLRVDARSVRGVADQPVTAQKPAIATEKYYEPVVHARVVTEQRPAIGKTAHKPRSAFELRANYRTQAAQKSRPIEVRRRSAKEADFDILEDTTIQNISAGPYASQHRQPQRAPTNGYAEGNKENAPQSEGSALPALSSSEWLAAGAIKKRETRRVSGRDGSAPLEGSSPGQRMVTDWLDDKKRCKENSPTAFV